MAQPATEQTSQLATDLGVDLRTRALDAADQADQRQRAASARRLHERAKTARDSAAYHLERTLGVATSPEDWTPRSVADHGGDADDDWAATATVAGMRFQVSGGAVYHLRTCPASAKAGDEHDEHAIVRSLAALGAQLRPDGARCFTCWTCQQRAEDERLRALADQRAERAERAEQAATATPAEVLVDALCDVIREQVDRIAAAIEEV